MDELLQPNQVVRTGLGQPCTVVEFLGSGGQGEVHRVRWAGGDFALKWYYAHTATQEQRAALESLIRQRAPSPAFLWPEDTAEADGVPGFGYLMPLRERRFRNLSDLMSGRIEPTFLVRITACIELTKAFRSLHNEGLCYRDISFGNAFLDPATGDILVCDNDNVAANRSAGGGVLGTGEFMAPEVVRGEARPSRDTDLHSLAVLLFYMLHIGHPLTGKRILGIHCWDLAAKEDLFGRRPLFIFDPSDDANEAVDLAHDPTGEAGGTALQYWRLYPRGLRDAFTKAFTGGLHHPKGRVDELAWLNTLVCLRDSLFRCACGKANFHDADAAPSGGWGTAPCWGCGRAPQLPFRIRVGRSVTMLNADTNLYAHHLGSGDFDFSKPAAQVVQHPTNPSIWGLKNLCDAKWVATMADGTAKDVEPGRSAPLANGVKVRFGKAEGEILY